MLTLCTLYAAQPIQPLFEQELHLSKFQAVIFTTAIMLPLGIAPIVYGFLLETVSSKNMLRWAILFLGILELIFSLNSHYLILLNLRGLQGVLIPAILTSIMSYISQNSTQDKVQQAISTYIGITILGGFLGRFFSGFLSDIFGWRFFFALLGVLLIGMFFILESLTKDVKPSFIKPSWKRIAHVIRIPHNFFIYITMFTVFFVFQGILNFIPFELRLIEGDFNGGKVGLVYAGYAIGLVVSLNAMRIIRASGSESKAMLIGGIIYLISIQLFHVRSFTSMFLVMFMFCLGMFIVHAIGSGYVNKLAQEYKAISNGLYISTYYAGGTLGTFVPGIVYEHFGWHWFLSVLSCVVTLSVILLFLLYRKMNASTKYV